MKFVPIKSRKPQSEFFGKRGISWHITVVPKTDASVVSGNNTSDINNDVSDNSGQANEHEMTDLSQENEDDNSVINKIGTNCFKYSFCSCF